MDRQLLTQNLKMLWATYHYAFRSKDPKDIASVVHVNSYKLIQWMQTDEWVDCLSFWGQKIKNGDLNFAEKFWTEMIEKYDDLSAIDFPDKPFKSPYTGDPDVYALIQSHLFCVDNLTECEIQERLDQRR